MPGDFSTYRGKALAAKKIQDYAYVKESLVLCDLSWPIYQVKDVDESLGFLTLESRIAKAITGRKTDERELAETGERIYNLQRAILIRQGWGGRRGDTIPEYLFTEPMNSVFFNRDCIVAGKDGQPVSLKGTVIDRAGFEQMKDEYYTLRGLEPGHGTADDTHTGRLEPGRDSGGLEGEGADGGGIDKTSLFHLLFLLLNTDA